ncbi:hypothetical protein N7462_011067 [Penicillium macrosclerotiorum]|uniref:uncharacterized protein n=1 Tax=Penicillium macrosclerotiorum TaxID=303699 RepID=UPI002547160D|nr:uncharacterized protein N7462_011067 [Penicillium macrosclerotiorum]KAJ5666658.1 hypothetical protein N7462_011067 [Penicillium macrosclerotiorum]
MSSSSIGFTAVIQNHTKAPGVRRCPILSASKPAEATGATVRNPLFATLQASGISPPRLDRFDAAPTPSQGLNSSPGDRAGLAAGRAGHVPSRNSRRRRMRRVA